MAKPKRTPLKQIRRYCLGCCGGSRKEVSGCTSTECELWGFRFGKRNMRIPEKGPGPDLGINDPAVGDDYLRFEAQGETKENQNDGEKDRNE